MKLFVDIWYNVVLSFSEKSAALLIVIDTQKCSNHMLQNKTYVTLKKPSMSCSQYDTQTCLHMITDRQPV